MKRFLSLSVVLVMGLMFAIPAFAATSSETLDKPVTDSADGEAPLVLVTEGVLKTLKPVSALSDDEVYIPDDPDAPRMILSDEDGSIMPLDSGKVHIPATNFKSSTDDYNESFSCKAGDGNRLNIWVKNNGSNTAVLNVDWSRFFGLVNEQYDAVEIPGDGGQYTMTFYYEDGRGISGDWDVNVTTLYGGTLDITVSARQYQYNG